MIYNITIMTSLRYSAALIGQSMCLHSGRNETFRVVGGRGEGGGRYNGRT